MNLVYILNFLGVASEHLSGDCNWRAVFDDLRGVNGPTIKLLYVTPEKIKASQALNDIFDSLYRKGSYKTKLIVLVVESAILKVVW